ncbi:MAG: hypothetical protein KDA24_24305 [Deltaproteobacteria bacterium]|nr:hypothetical protein [Deltaproteobacteria bacterium]
MNDLMKGAIADTGMHWAATVPLVLFVVFFSAVVIWTWSSTPAAAPSLDWE